MHTRPIDNVVMFVTLLATALALGAAMAHALELPNKIGLGRDDYFVVQRAYDGWSNLAYLLVVELVAMVLLAYLYRRQPGVLWAAVAAVVCLLLAQAVFWAFTYPANVATSNWTVMPDNWEQLRVRWEYSHLAGAFFQVLAMSALIVAALNRR
jgi:hypothetical protein